MEAKRANCTDETADLERQTSNRSKPDATAGKHPHTEPSTSVNLEQPTDGLSSRQNMVREQPSLQSDRDISAKIPSQNLGHSSRLMKS
jgi:hypothetical protein